MTAIAAWTSDFDTGSDGAAVGTGFFSSVTGTGTATYTGASPFTGALAVAISTSGANKSLEKITTARGLAWNGFALKVTTAPSAVVAVFNTYLTGTLIGNLRLNSNRTLNFRDSATSRWTSSTVLALNTWYEIRVLTNPGADVARVKIYDATGTLLEDSGNLTFSANLAALVDEFRIGLLSGSVTGGIVIDRMVADDATEPATAPTSTPYLYYDNGTTWTDVSGSLYYDNGTAWVPVVVGDITP